MEQFFDRPLLAESLPWRFIGPSPVRTQLSCGTSASRLFATCTTVRSRKCPESRRQPLRLRRYVAGAVVSGSI